MKVLEKHADMSSLAVHGKEEVDRETGCVPVDFSARLPSSRSFFFLLGCDGGNDSVKRMGKGVKDIVFVREQYDSATFPVGVTGWAH